MKRSDVEGGLSIERVCDCGRRATIQWGDTLAVTHGGGRWRCELCCLRDQLAHAEERAALIPEMRARIAELEAT